jgi:hypothetical protein
MLLAATLLGLAGGPAAAGCDTLDDAQRVVDRADLVGDLVARLDQAEQLTYTADYRLAGGAPATVARAGQPKIAYTYADGKLIMTSDANTECRGAGTAMNCTVTAVGSPAPEPPAALLNTLSSRGIISAPVVVGLLNATALDSDASVQQRDTTIAGQHATCVNVASVDNAAASAFDVCITTDGVVGSFAGVLNGARVELALTQYRSSVAVDAFEPPTGAKLVDRRPSHS